MKRPSAPRARLALAALAGAAVLAAGCSDDDGRPDLDAVSEDDFPVTAEVELGPRGCNVEAVEVSPRTLLTFEAAVDGVSATATGTDLATGEMRAGERVVWRLVDEDTLEVECEGPSATSTLEVDVADEPPSEISGARSGG